MVNEKIMKLADCGFEIEETLERFLSNEALYLRFLKKFLEDTNYQKLRESLDEKDYEEAFSYAHTLKGVTGNLGISCLYQPLAAIVDALRAKTEESYAKVPELLVQVSENYERCKQVIEAL